MTKKETFKWVVQIIASIATAILTAMGTTSCMVLDEKSVLEFDFLNALALFCFFGGRDATTMANFRLVVTKQPHLLQQLRAKSW